MNPNVVIFGESGSGKSSIVNLLVGREVASVSEEAVGCTFQFQKYQTANYTMFDTVGLSEGSKGTIKQSVAVNQLINLLKSLENGVSLLIFVMKRGKITQSVDENYKLFVEAICMKKVPVVLMVTHCEDLLAPEEWFGTNRHHFEKSGLHFTKVVCGCARNPESSPLMMREAIKELSKITRDNLEGIIKETMIMPGWILKGGWKSWLQTILTTVLNMLFGNLIPKSWFDSIFTREPSFQERLYLYFVKVGYEELVARQMAEQIAKAC